MEIKWEDGYKISLNSDGNSVIISANREGLQSLANLLAGLSNDDIGSHIHLDEYNALEAHSMELIIEKIP